MVAGPVHLENLSQLFCGFDLSQFLLSLYVIPDLFSDVEICVCQTRTPGPLISEDNFFYDSGSVFGLVSYCRMNLELLRHLPDCTV